MKNPVYIAIVFIVVLLIYNNLDSEEVDTHSYQPLSKFPYAVDSNQWYGYYTMWDEVEKSVKNQNYALLDKRVKQARDERLTFYTGTSVYHDIYSAILYYIAGHDMALEFVSNWKKNFRTQIFPIF